MSHCPEPVTFETWLAWFTGGLDAAEAARVETHLFECDACASASNRLGELIGGLREIIPPILSHAHRDRLIAAGVNVRQTPVNAGVDAHARFAPGVDLLVHVLHADLARAERVDVEALTQDGVVRVAFEHVPFDAEAGEVLVACQRHYEGMLSHDPVFRVHAVEAGVRRPVGDYFIVHEWK
jgi:anti-sigma factor RsiW